MEIVRLRRPRDTSLDDAMAVRLRELDERAAELTAGATELARREEAARNLAEEVERRLQHESAELDAREAALDELAKKLARRDAGLGIRESELEERRRQLGAVELQRAAVERREAAVAEREQALLVNAHPRPVDATSHVLFVPGDGYSLIEEAGAPPAPGTSLELAGQHYVVLRLGASPLPDDARTCAFLSN
jgi:septal ring factor EnvC (AmiA/AmiB activator)